MGSWSRRRAASALNYWSSLQPSFRRFNNPISFSKAFQETIPSHLIDKIKALTISSLQQHSLILPSTLTRHPFLWLRNWLKTTKWFLLCDLLQWYVFSFLLFLSLNSCYSFVQHILNGWGKEEGLQIQLQRLWYSTVVPHCVASPHCLWLVLIALCSEGQAVGYVCVLQHCFSWHIYQWHILHLGMPMIQRAIAHYEKCSVEHMSNSILDSGPLDDFAMVYWGDSRGVKI